MTTSRPRSSRTSAAETEGRKSERPERGRAYEVILVLSIAYDHGQRADRRRIATRLQTAPITHQEPVQPTEMAMPNLPSGKEAAPIRGISAIAARPGGAGAAAELDDHPDADGARRSRTCVQSRLRASQRPQGLSGRERTTAATSRSVSRSCRRFCSPRSAEFSKSSHARSA